MGARSRSPSHRRLTVRFRAIATADAVIQLANLLRRLDDPN